ncbi:MAG: hypothetical protein J7621_08435 [Niastella sp.]|nr:hypothetical protein [Niastella sp.]
MKYLKLVALVVLFSWAGKASACKCANNSDKIDKPTDLKPYEFIALVKVGKPDTLAAGNDGRSTMKWNINIIEKFKGQDITAIADRPYFTSCNIGLQTGDEWLLFGKIVDGQLSIVACDRNTPYKRINGEHHWRSPFGTSLLDRLRSLYPPEKGTLPPPRRERKNSVLVDTVAVVNDRTGKYK